MTSDINLGDILSRTNFSRKGTLRKYKVVLDLTRLVHSGVEFMVSCHHQHSVI